MLTDPVVTPHWLNENLHTVAILDATYFLPPDPARVRSEFEAVRIPGARLFEIDEIADKSSPLPHMMPDTDTFARAMAELGIDGAKPVVVYDRSSNHFSAPRVWYTLRAFGLERVYVLDGGLRTWTAANNPVEIGPEQRHTAPLRSWDYDASRILSAHDVLGVLTDKSAPVIDARSAGRFAGTEPEPRAGLRPGRMPGAYNLPFDTLTEDDGSFASIQTLHKILPTASEPGEPVTTCGSGMTAAVLALGMARIGVRARLYDGSWTEWGADDHLPVETG